MRPPCDLASEGLSLGSWLAWSFVLTRGCLVAELFEEYCERVVSTSDWGGQLELRALACALQTPIHVFSAESDVIAMGQEFDAAGDRKPLQLTYHLHYYTLGEHFNSVAPASS